MTIVKATRTALAMSAIAATVFAFSATAGSSTAEAKKLIIKIGHGHHLHHRHFFRPRLILTTYGTGCGWLKLKALETGSPYWWHRYRVCRFY